MRLSAEGGNSPAEGACLYLFYKRGRQPAPDQIGAALAQASSGIVSHRSETPRAESNSRIDWVELLCDGLTFDLRGVAPGHGLGPIVPAQSLGLSQEYLAECEVLGLTPGPHLAGAANTQPVVRTMVRIGAALLSPELDGVAALWGPADLATDVGRFVPLVQNWLAGGPSPSPLMVRTTEDDGAVETRGLEFFLGHELRVDPDWKNGADTTRLIMGLADRLIASCCPPVDEVMTLVDGTQVVAIARRRRILLVPA